VLAWRDDPSPSRSVALGAVVDRWRVELVELAAVAPHRRE
jgi:hypothetical protein